MTTRVLVAGAGVGGLTLAHGLRRAGFEVRVFESDPSSELRQQGYRIHIDADGNAGLGACLPPEVLDLVRRTSGVHGDRVSTYTAGLEEVHTFWAPPAGDDVVSAVDRLTFRRALLTGLDDVVAFDRTLTGFRVRPDGGVRAEFADGSTAEGDLLVGADGVGSAVRRRLAPDATVRDLGLRCLYGRLPLTAATRSLVPAPLATGFTWIADERGFGAGFGPMEFRTPVAYASDYLMTTLLGSPDQLAATDDELRALDPAGLHRLAVTATASWHPELHALFEHADPASFFPISIRAADRVETSGTGPVTLLGDAVHAMPPAGGVGANTALRDAALLVRELSGSAADGTSPTDALRRYEAGMVAHGAATVAGSLELLGRMVALPAAA